MDKRVQEVFRRLSTEDKDFSGLDLSTHDLSYPQRWFTRCSFSDADLRHATLDGVSFMMCDFSGADLRAASLRGARFSGCSFRGADMRDTDLSYANFGGMNTGDPEYGMTDLSDAKLDGARIDHAVTEESTIWPDGFTPPPTR